VSTETDTGIRALDRAAIARVDRQDRLTDVLALPEHLRDALWKVESAQLGEWDSTDGLIVAGMGHSALGGLLARAALGDHASRPILPARAYGLPPWTTPDTTVLCASYSGETEETLACFEAAGALGAPRVVATSGGRLAELAREEGVPVIPIAGGLTAPTAVGYLFVAALEVAARCGAAPGLTSELDVAAEHLEELVTAWGPETAEDSEAKTLARALTGTVPVIAGAGLTTPLAQRWKASLNVVARMPAFAAELPDLDHHEVAGWIGAGSSGARFSAVFLDDCDTHPRVQSRVALTRELVEPHAAGTHVVGSRGQTAAERVLSLVLLGDLVSHYIAALQGIDPADPGPTQQIKQQLGD
jgi:glucose/mannose-6-phosphate isomerase